MYTKTSVYDPLELVRPRYDSPEDPKWPAPLIVDDIYHLLRRLAKKQKVACALTAAEMSLSIFQQHTEPNSFVDEVLTQAWNIFNGKEENKDRPLPRWACDVPLPPNGPAWMAGCSIVAACSAVLGIRRKNSHLKNSVLSACCHAVSEAAEAFDRMVTLNNMRIFNSDLPVYTPGIRKKFLVRWWAKCRCRLAFMDAASAELV